MAKPIDLTTPRNKQVRQKRSRPQLPESQRVQRVQLDTAGTGKRFRGGQGQAAISQALTNFFPVLQKAGDAAQRRALVAQKLEDGKNTAKAEALVRSDPTGALEAIRSGNTGAFFGEDVAKRRVTMDAAARALGVVTAGRDQEELETFLKSMPADAMPEDGVAEFVERQLEGAENPHFMDTYSASVYSGARATVNGIYEGRAKAAKSESIALARDAVVGRLDAENLTVDSLPGIREEAMATIHGSSAERVLAADQVVYSALEEAYVNGNGQAARLLTTAIPGRDGLSYRDLYPKKFQAATISSIERAGRAKTLVQKARNLDMKERFAMISGGQPREGDDMNKLQLDILQELENGPTDELLGLSARVSSAREGSAMLGAAVEGLTQGLPPSAKANDDLSEAWANGTVGDLSDNPAAEVAVFNHVSKVGMSKDAREQSSQGLVTGDAEEAKAAWEKIKPMLDHSTAPDSAFLTKDGADIAFLAEFGGADFETTRQKYLESREDIGNPRSHLSRRLFDDELTGTTGVEEVAENIYEAAHPSLDTTLWWDSQRDWDDALEETKEWYRQKANGVSVTLSGQPGVTKSMIEDLGAKSMQGKVHFETIYSPDGERHAMPRVTPLGVDRLTDRHMEQVAAEAERFMPGVSVGGRPDRHTAGDGMYALTIEDVTGATTDLVMRAGDVVPFSPDDKMLAAAKTLGAIVTHDDSDDDRVFIEFPEVPDHPVLIPIGDGASNMFWTNTGGQWQVRILPRNKASDEEIEALLLESSEVNTARWENTDANAAVMAAQKRAHPGSSVDLDAMRLEMINGEPTPVAEEGEVVNVAPRSASPRIYQAPNGDFTRPVDNITQTALEESRRALAGKGVEEGMLPTVEMDIDPATMTYGELIDTVKDLKETLGGFVENTMDPNNVGKMTTLTDFIKGSEGFKGAIYADPSQSDKAAGKEAWAVGFGYNITYRSTEADPDQARREMAAVGLDVDKVMSGEQIVGRTQATELMKVAMKNDLHHLKTVTLKGVKMADHRWMALASLAYNVGMGTMEGYKLMGQIKRGEWEDATRNIATLIDNQGPKWKEGIVRRRYGEAIMFWGSYPLPKSIPSPALIGAEANAELDAKFPDNPKRVDEARLERGIHDDREAVKGVLQATIKRLKNLK